MKHQQRVFYLTHSEKPALVRGFLYLLTLAIPIVSLCLLPVTSFAGNTSGCDVVKSGIIACYPFNGNADDISDNNTKNRNNTNGNVNGATLTSDIIGNPNSAYSFNGAGNYIQVPGNLNLGSAFTLSTWISAPKEYRNRDILVKGNNAKAPGYMGIYLSDAGQFGFYASDLTHLVPAYLNCPHNLDEMARGWPLLWAQVGNPVTAPTAWNNIANAMQICNSQQAAQPPTVPTTPTNISSGVVVDDGQFHHLVVTYGNNQLIFYVDGKNVHQETVSGNVANVVAPTLIGKQSDSSQQDTMLFKGVMDDVILYNRALSASEVVQLEGILPDKCKNVTTGLVACYSFENNLLDSSGNGNNGNPVNISYIPGKDGNALSLNGMNSLVWIPNPAQQFDSEYTISGWILKRDNTGSGSVFNKYSYNWSSSGSSGRGFVLGFNTPAGDSPDGSGGHTLFSAFVAGGIPSLLAYPQYTFPLNEFKYVTATYDKTGTSKLYIDGVQVDQKSYPHLSLGNYYNILLGDGSGSDGTVLSSTYNGGRTFNGAIDELRLYNRALSESEIRQLCGSACASPPPSKCQDLTNGLVGCYSFEDSLRDDSGNWNNGRLAEGISYVPGKNGKALRLNGGPNSYVWISNPDQKFNSEYTIAGWISLNSDMIGVPVAKWSANPDGSCWGFALGVISPTYTSVGHTLFNVFTDGGCKDYGSLYPNYTFPKFGESKYVTATYQNGNFKLYIDGALVDQKSHPYSPYLNNPYGILLGGNWSYNGSTRVASFDGTIDELRLYNRALSDAEVKQLASQATLQATLIVNQTGTGIGSVTCNGTPCQSTATYPLNSTIALTATPDANSTVQWGDACGNRTTPDTYTVKLDKDPTTCTVTFTKKLYTLTVTGTGTGTVSAINAQALTQMQALVQAIGQAQAQTLLQAMTLTCKSPGSCPYNYSAGDKVTLSATFDKGYAFTGWTGDCANTNPVTVTMDKAKSCTATFQQVFTLTVSKTGTGTGNITGTGMTCGTNCVANTSVTLTATATTGSSFTGWSGDCKGTNATVTVTMTQAKTCTATFDKVIPKYTLTVSKTGTGTGSITGTGITCGTDCTEDVVANTPVTLTAAATTGSSFTGWTGASDCTSTNATVTVTMTQAKTCTATFDKVIPKYTLTVSKTGTGTGSITGTGITCGTDCTEDLVANTPVTLTAAATAGSSFTGWSGASDCTGTNATVTVTMDKVKGCTATFDKVIPKYTLTVSKTGTGTGSITGTGINCGTDCTEDVVANTPVTLTATATTGSSFTGWTGDCTGTTASVTVTMAQAKTCAATFNTIAPIYTLTVSKMGTGTGTITATGIDCGTVCTADYTAKTPVTLTATPDTGFKLLSWGGACSGNVATFTLTKTVALQNCIANFIPANVTIATLTVAKEGTGKGTIQAQVIGQKVSPPPCGVTCLTQSYDYTLGSLLNVVATPAPGFTFKGWSCNGSYQPTGTPSLIKVTMDAAKTCTATFQ